MWRYRDTGVHKSQAENLKNLGQLTDGAHTKIHIQVKEQSKVLLVNIDGTDWGSNSGQRY